jgi:serine protease Do
MVIAEHASSLMSDRMSVRRGADPSGAPHGTGALVGLDKACPQTNQPMKTKPILLIVVSAAASLGLVSLIHADALPQLKTDNAPLSAEARPNLSFAPVIKQVAPAVVNIYTNKTTRADQGMAPFLDDPFFRRFFGGPFESMPRERKEQALGSGVIVSTDGYILTNSHVVEGADEIKVALNDNKTTYDAKLVGTDPQTDIAVIKVSAKDLPAITLTDSDNVQVGDVVLAIGNPFGIGQTVTMGIVSAKGRGGMGIVDYEDFIQTDASINPGNSGGALVDATGRLIGINQSIISRSGGNQGVGFSVPVNLAKYVMERLVADGRVTRGYLGVMIQPVTDDLAKAFDLKDNSGALVGDVTEDSPAEEAGLKEGDVITEFNGKKVNSSQQLRLMVSQTAPGTKAPVKLLRDGKPMDLSVKLGELPKEGLAKAGMKRGGGDELLDGVTVDDLDNRARRQFGLPNALDGAVVTEVGPSSPAARAGLQPGDVIVEINRRRASNADEAVRMSEGLEGDRVLLRVWSRGGSRYLVISK